MNTWEFDTCAGVNMKASLKASAEQQTNYFLVPSWHPEFRPFPSQLWSLRLARRWPGESQFVSGKLVTRRFFGEFRNAGLRRSVTQLWTFYFKSATWKSCGFTAHWLPNVCMRWCLGGTEEGRLAKLKHTLSNFINSLCSEREDIVLHYWLSGLRCGWKWTVNLCPSPYGPLTERLHSHKNLRAVQFRTALLAKKKKKSKKKTDKKTSRQLPQRGALGGHLGDWREQNKGAQMRGSLPRRWWHHSLAPSAKPGYMRCRDLRCRPEPLFL